MAIDADKKTNSDGEGPTFEARVGREDSSSITYRIKLRRLRLTKRRGIAVGLIILVVIAGFLFGRNTLHVGQKVYAQAAGHKIYKQDIQALIGSQKGISYHQAATVLADKYLAQAMAEEDKVNVTGQDIENTYGKDILSQKKTQPYDYQKAINRLYYQRLARYNQSGTYKGQYLIANFGRHVPYTSPLLKEQEAADPTLGNQALIAADKKYAKKFITQLYDQIKSHKMTFDQAIKAEHNDPRVGVDIYSTQPHSGPFDTSIGYGTVVNADATRAKLKNMEQGGMSKPFVAGGSNIMAGPYYLVIRMDEAKGGLGLPYNQFLQQAKDKFGYKVYV